jgi:hypothetical protein
LTLDFDGQFLRKRIHHTATDTVESTGDGISATTELSTGVQGGQHDLDGRSLFHRVFIYGNSSTIVGHSDCTIGESRH